MSHTKTAKTKKKVILHCSPLTSSGHQSRSAHLPSRLAHRWARRCLLEPVWPGSKDYGVRWVGSQPKPPLSITSYQRQLVLASFTGSRGTGSHGTREDDSSKTFYHVLSLTI